MGSIAWCKMYKYFAPSLDNFRQDSPLTYGTRLNILLSVSVETFPAEGQFPNPPGNPRDNHCMTTNVAENREPQP
jgi:hypothetical protein